MIRNRSLRTLAAAASIALLAAVPAFAQDATPTRTPEPLPDCPAFEDEATDVRTGYYMGEGIAYLNANRLGEAQFAFTCIIRVVDPSYTLAYLARGEVFLNQRDLNRAIEDFGAAFQRDSGSVIALNNRGIAYFLLGEYDEAAADFDRALGVDGDYLPAVNNQAVTTAVQGEIDDAIALVDAAITSSGAADALVTARDPQRPSDAEPIEIAGSAVRLYALRGILESQQTLGTFNAYRDLMIESNRNPDERINAAAAGLESRLTFELRLDDGSWLLRSRYSEGG